MRILARRCAALAAATAVTWTVVVASSPAAVAAERASAARAIAVAALSQHLIGVPARRAGSGAAHAGVEQDYSFNWSGYVEGVTGSRTYTAVSATWREPTVTCSRETRIAAFWVGLDGWNSGTVEQDGTIAECYQGHAYHFTWWEMYPTNNIQVVADAKVGDLVTSSVAFAHGRYTLAVKDATTRAASFTTAQTCGAGLTCSNSSAEWIAEAPTGPTGEFPLAKYTPVVSFDNSVTSGGHKGTITSFPAGAVTMIDESQSYPLATVSGLRRGGRGFTDSWHNSF